MTFSARAAKRRGLKISHCFSRKLQWILFERDETVANVILMTLNIRNYRFIAIFLRISTKWNMDKSIVRPPRKAMSSWAGRTIELSHASSDMKSHENNVCIHFVSLEQNSSQLSWETMTYFQPSPLRGSGWKCYCFSLKLRWILFSRDKMDGNASSILLLIASMSKNMRTSLCVWTHSIASIFKK